MKNRIKLPFLVFIFLFSACSEDTNVISVRLGEIRGVFVDANGRSEMLSFPMESSVAAQDSHGYTASLRYLSIYRRMSPPNNANNLHIRATNFDIQASTTPITLNSNARLTLNLRANEIYEGKNGAITLTINKKSDDILEGTFSGSITNQSNPNDVYTVKNGEFKIRIQRF